MAIDFNALPNNKPNGFFKEPGLYKAKIIKAEMRASSTPGKPDYLSLTYDLIDKNNKAAGKFYDNFFESDAEIPRWKIKRLIEALGITGLTKFNLKDLTKICVNKTILVDIGVDRKEPDKNVVDVFTGDVYYPEAEWFAKTASAEAVLGGSDDDDSPIDAPDAEDADVASSESADY